MLLTKCQTGKRLPFVSSFTGKNPSSNTFHLRQSQVNPRPDFFTLSPSLLPLTSPNETNKTQQHAESRFPEFLPPQDVFWQGAPCRRDEPRLCQNATQALAFSSVLDFYHNFALNAYMYEKRRTFDVKTTALKCELGRARLGGLLQAAGCPPRTPRPTEAFCLPARWDRGQRAAARRERILFARKRGVSFSFFEK